MQNIYNNTDKEKVYKSKFKPIFSNNISKSKNIITY